MKIFTVANVPDGLQQKWLQHLRDFDVANPGCHFEVIADVHPDTPLEEVIEMLSLNPALSQISVIDFPKRKQP
jgi:hypothetical protein